MVAFLHAFPSVLRHPTINRGMSGSSSLPSKSLDGVRGLRHVSQSFETSDKEATPLSHTDSDLLPVVGDACRGHHAFVVRA